MLDIDHFKAINDECGHAVGDQVLQQVAETLKGIVRQSDFICRYGGEEFCILLPHSHLEEASQAAERLRQAIATRSYSNLNITASLGVTALSLGAREPLDLLDQADRALYAAKRTGRNRVVRTDAMPALDDPGPPPHLPSPPAEAEVVPIPFHAVTALLSALAYRNVDTGEHSRRVADLCVALANGLMPQRSCYILEVAGLLHDIGKLGVPDSILLKPGPLTPEEWKVMRTHEQVGVEILAAAFTCAELTSFVRTHHAWFGGTPYDPDLPKGTDIPLGARILSIADAYDAMISNRVYRPGRSREAAFAELRRCAGKQFDPELVERFIEIVLSNDMSRNKSELQLSKQAALRIGVQIEKLACAIDAQDNHSLALMAGRLQATASESGVRQIADLASQLQRSAQSANNWLDPLQLTINLLDLCRSTYSSYLPRTSPWATSKAVAQAKMPAAEPVAP
jgi:diguanylate cyclase (GGDEF)-like protein